WALIEWDTANEEPNAYTVIESSQIVDIPSHEGRSDENHNGPQRKRDAGLYTGKMVHVRRGRYIMPATIVMISEDRKFLETELQELRVMVANCLMTKSRRDSVSSVTNSKDNGGAGKRLSTAATTTTTQEPSGAAAGNEEATISFSSDCSHQTESSPPPPPPMRTKMARYTHADRRAPSRHEAPPMTFDQQTQTTGAASDAYGSQQQDAHFARVLSYLESIMAEQKSCRMESDYNRKLTELHKKQQPSGKQGRSGDVMVANVVPESDGTVFSYETTSTNNNHIVVSSLKENGSQQWLKLQSVKRIADVDRQQPDHTTSNSNQSWASSSVAATSNNTTSNAAADDSIAKSCSESTANNTTTTMFVEFEDEIVSTIGNSSPNSSSAVAVQELIRDDWNDSLQDNPTSEKVPLGSNNTLVPKRALEAVRWHSYKFGTRKLLQMLFTRETLASCSLSGRPCPARINEVDRPVKGALPPKVVADIVEYVMKKCNVEECHVRGVITNKCADENKMLRQR
ncbi:AGAP009151-PA, partial [Anopheles gambiae str. PEST]